MPDQRLLICPYCGETQPESDRCRACAGLFEPLSRQATHNAMGPWFVRDEQRPHQPGCSYETLVRLIQRGRVTRYTIVRGPTTRQFWTIAKRVPGISHYFGACYQCDASVDADDRSCHACGATFGGFLDRNFLGLPEYRPLPWEADQTHQQRADTEPGEPTDWRQQTSSAAEGPRGISSFATDEELLGEVPVASDDYVEVSPQPLRGKHTSGTDPCAAMTDAEQPAEVSAPDSSEPTTAVDTAKPEVDLETHPAIEVDPQSSLRRAAERSHGEAAIRAMQRKLVKQERTIRTLTYAAIGLAAVTIIIALLWADLRSRADAPAQPAQRQIDTDRAVWDLPELESDVPSRGRTDQDSVLDVETAAQESDTPARASVFTEEHQSAYDEATRLMENAADTSRDLASRISDLERAISALEDIKRNVAESALPDDFWRKLTEARRTLERLRLREFFP
jgi:hypothetical protein